VGRSGTLTEPLPAKPMLSIHNMTKVFVAEGGEQVRALADLSLECTEHEFLCVLGPTGCGKTTLLRLLAGLEQPTSGDVLIDGRPPIDRHCRAGFVFQENALFPWRTALSNVLFGPETQRWKRRVALERARECLRMVGLTDVEDRYPYELSGGMQQRVAIARALAPEPRLLLMDEPFGALDERTRQNLQNELLRLWQVSGLTVVFVTHNIEEAVYLAQRVVVLGIDPGRVVDELTVDLPHPRDRMSPTFVEYLLRVRDTFARVVA